MIVTRRAPAQQLKMFFQNFIERFVINRNVELLAEYPCFIRQNAIWLALLLLAGVATGFCFLMWLRTFSRPQAELFTLGNAAHAHKSPEAVPSAERDLSSTEELPVQTGGPKADHAGEGEPDSE